MFARACTRLLKIVLALSSVRAVGRPPGSRPAYSAWFRTPSACDARSSCSGGKPQERPSLSLSRGLRDVRAERVGERDDKLHFEWAWLKGQALQAGCGATAPAAAAHEKREL